MTECNRCGDCCEDIWLGTSKRREIIAYGDPRDDAIWQAWVDSWTAEGLQKGQLAKRPGFIYDYLTAAFVVEHWHGGVRAKGPATKHWTCDAFDTETRLCTAHADRPPVCSGYPWYGRAPTPEGAQQALSKRCSFWADVPEEHQPEAVRVELRRSAA